MSEPYILSCESTVDLPYSYVAGRNIPVLFYSYTIDGETFVDDMLRAPDALPHFYALLNAGKFSNTSQINTYDYETYFDEQLQKGDLLHIVFGSGMTASVRNAEEAADSMRKKYPDRKLIVIDSLCSSSGYGMLVDEAAVINNEDAFTTCPWKTLPTGSLKTANISTTSSTAPISNISAAAGAFPVLPP